jgi:hypothetical protein
MQSEFGPEKAFDDSDCGACRPDADQIGTSSPSALARIF